MEQNKKIQQSFGFSYKQVLNNEAVEWHDVNLTDIIINFVY
jgi:hypothetical protein